MGRVRRTWAIALLLTGALLAAVLTASGRPDGAAHQASSSPKEPHPARAARGPERVAEPDHGAGLAGRPPGPARRTGTRTARSGAPVSEPGTGERPLATIPGQPGDKDPAATSLDDAPPDRVRAALESAIQRTAATRPLRVDPAVVERVVRDGSVRIVFDHRTARDPAALRARLRRHSGARLDPLRVFPLLEAGAARLGPEALRALIESGETGSIELDRVHRPALRSSLRVIRGELAHADGAEGQGRVVAVLDTGVDTSHPLLADRIVDEACFSALGHCPNGEQRMFGPGAGAPCPWTLCGHGTHVAGVAVADDPEADLRGVAPRASLLVIRIFSEIEPGEIGAFGSDILAGLQHVLALSVLHPIAAANLSLGADPYVDEAGCDRAAASQHDAVRRLRERGVVVVAAAGNEGLTNALTSPACLSNVIGVSASDDGDAVVGFSNTAPFLSLLAPGRSIESARAGGGTGWASGTSAAAPHVAGAVAVLRASRPAATAQQIENVLGLSGVPVFDSRTGETKPRLDLLAALDLLAVMPSEPPEPAGEPSLAGGTTTDPASAASPAGGGGGGCGLVGIEPWLVLGLVRIWRRAGRSRKPGPDAGPDRGLRPRACG